MNNNKETRVTNIEDVEISEELDSNEEIKTSDLISEEELSNRRDEVFENLKIALIEEKRLLGRFSSFCEEHNNFEYDEMGMNMEEGENILRMTNKIRDKFLAQIQEKLLYIFENPETNTLTHIITFDLDTKENQFKIIIEVLEDSFNLEVK